LYFPGFKIEADHVVLGAGETFAALIHHISTADKKRCSWDRKLTFREFFSFKKKQRLLRKRRKVLLLYVLTVPEIVLYIFQHSSEENVKIFVKFTFVWEQSRYLGIYQIIVHEKIEV
jgi:hypothetical protein